MLLQALARELEGRQERFVDREPGLGERDGGGETTALSSLPEPLLQWLHAEGGTPT
jgi:hypothetical protein